MYYQDYEDYMKNVLGPRYTPNYMLQGNNNYPYNNYYVPTYGMPMNNPNQEVNSMQQYNNIPVSNNDIQISKETKVEENYEIGKTEEKAKKMYPEIYTLLTPMVERTLAENNEKEITDELVETMTNKIYSSIQDDMEVKQVSTAPSNVANNKNINQNVKQVANQQVSRRPQNHTLRDLIKILLLNRIIESLRPNRPRENDRPMPRPDNKPRMMQTYPTMNYFNTPYPEDEYIG